MVQEVKMNTLFVVIYNLAILAGTVFLIVEYDWSAWWMLLAVCLLGTSSSKE
jgi:1,4-dihydroxy-2-naphthoate octaprenyltransferase